MYIDKTLLGGGGGGGRLGMFKNFLFGRCILSRRPCHCWYFTIAYLRFSLSLSQFQPISVLFVTVSAVLWRCFKAMSLVRILP